MVLIARFPWKTIRWSCWEVVFRTCLDGCLLIHSIGYIYLYFLFFIFNFSVLCLSLKANFGCFQQMSWLRLIVGGACVQQVGNLIKGVSEEGVEQQRIWWKTTGRQMSVKLTEVPTNRQLINNYGTKGVPNSDWKCFPAKGLALKILT